jgi:hypothetical protein
VNRNERIIFFFFTFKILFFHFDSVHILIIHDFGPLLYRRKKKCSREEGEEGNTSSSEGEEEGEECHALYRQEYQSMPPLFLSQKERE